MDTNFLYFGDNLKVLRDCIRDESVDLIYLDPPFNSNRSYNVLFKETGRTSKDSSSQAQITAFDDSWHWSEAANQTMREIETTARPEIVQMMQSIVRFVGHNDVSAYLVMMTIRLIELRRVLKSTGSIYLHCDPTASHYLKVVMDTIFGAQNFRNEIVWQRTSAHANVIAKYGAIHDTILFYTVSDKFTWNPQHTPHDKEYLETFFDQVDNTGRRYARRDLTASMQRASSGQLYEWKGIRPPASRCWAMTKDKMDELDAQGRIHWPIKEAGMPRLKIYPEDTPGSPLQDIWTDIKTMHNLSAERLGYPTQKPLALLERIILGSSNPGDLVLDPFCGCGTTVCAAEKTGRRWIGVDITHLAIALMRQRLYNMFGETAKYEVIGQPADLASAQALALQDRHGFELWAISLLSAQVAQEKKGSDRGMDGLLFFVDEARAPAKKVVIQVKSGHVQASYIRDLAHVVDRERAAMGFLVTLEEPSKPMLTEALTAGYYHSPGWNRDYPKIQIRTIEQLLQRQRFEYPLTNISLAQAQRVQPQSNQEKLF
jgi:site-specific DNA-methyltransferase (adenine-specific)